MQISSSNTNKKYYHLAYVASGLCHTPDCLLSANGPERIKIKMEAHRIIHLECLHQATSKNSLFFNFYMHRNSLMLEKIARYKY